MDAQQNFCCQWCDVFVSHGFLANYPVLSPSLRAWSTCKLPALHLLGAFSLFLCRDSTLSGDFWKGCEQQFKKHLRNIVEPKSLRWKEHYPKWELIIWWIKATGWVCRVSRWTRIRWSPFSGWMAWCEHLSAASRNMFQVYLVSKAGVQPPTWTQLTETKTAVRGFFMWWDQRARPWLLHKRFGWASQWWKRRLA